MTDLVRLIDRIRHRFYTGENSFIDADCWVVPVQGEPVVVMPNGDTHRVSMIGAADWADLFQGIGIGKVNTEDGDTP